MEENQKVIFVSHSSVLNGAPVCLAETVEVIRRQNKGIEALIGFPGSGKLLDRFDFPKENTFFFARGFRGKEIPIASPRIRKRLSRLFAEQKADVVVANTLEAFQAVRAAVDEGIPCLWLIHELVESYLKRKEFPQICDAASLVTRLIFNSNLSLGMAPMLGEGVKDRAGMIYPGIELPALPGPGKADRSGLGIGRDEVVLASVGDICPMKGYDELLQAFAAIQEKFPRARLLVVGRVPSQFRKYHAHLIDFCRERGLTDSVNFMGEREDVSRLMPAFDLLLHASWRESLGRVVLEALSWELPVVATRSGGVEEIVEDGVHALLVPPRAAEPLARAALRMLANPGEGREMGRRGRKMVGERFSLARAVQSLRRELENCGCRPGPRPGV